MKKFLISSVKAIGQTLFSTLIFLVVLEIACLLVGFPRGAQRYYEGVVVSEKLSTYKPKDEFRIFVYGESSMHGSHYAPVSNPARWLEAYLKDFLPADKKIRMVNFSRMGSGQHVIYEAFRDTVEYKPDLAVFYYGHNLFLPGNRKDQVEKKENKPSAVFKSLLRRSRLFSAMYRLAVGIRLKTKKDEAGQDSIEYKIIETMPWGIGPENAVPNNTPRYAENIEWFRRESESIVELARKKRIKLLLCRPAGNLKDFSPFMSVHMRALSPEELKAFEEHYENGKKAEESGRPSEALIFYNQAWTIDPQYADLCFRMASIYFKQGELDKARQLFEAARDFDAIKVRAGSDVLTFYDGLKTGPDLSVVNVEKVLVPEIPGAITGDPMIEDNVHLSIRGHALLGRALAQEIAEKEWIVPKSKWRFDRQRSDEEISKQLGVNPDLQFSADIKMVPYFGSRYDNRIFFANKALGIYPDHPKALRHLAWSYWLKGDKDRALAVYEGLGQKHPEALREVFQNNLDVKKAFVEKFPSLKI